MRPNLDNYFTMEEKPEKTSDMEINDTGILASFSRGFLRIETFEEVVEVRIVLMDY